MSNKNSVTHKIAHDLEPEKAGAIGRKAINAYVKQYPQFTGRWESPTHFKLQVKIPFSKITGFVDIGSEQITFHIDKVPSMFRKYVDTAIEQIDAGVKEHINKAKLDR